LNSVDNGIGAGIRLYDIVLDLRDLADKNPALAMRLRKIADEIDHAVDGLVDAADAMIDVRYAVDDDEELAA
jgi:hypothetical protein